MKRIRPEEVVAAYRATGLRPRQCTVIHNGFACAIGAMYVERGQPRDCGALQWADSIYASLYISGFIRGFDCDAHDTAANDDGAAAWQAVVAAGLVGVA